jgi:hypothetical protein
MKRLTPKRLKRTGKNFGKFAKENLKEGTI